MRLHLANTQRRLIRTFVNIFVNIFYTLYRLTDLYVDVASVFLQQVGVVRHNMAIVKLSSLRAISNNMDLTVVTTPVNRVAVVRDRRSLRENAGVSLRTNPIAVDLSHARRVAMIGTARTVDHGPRYQASQNTTGI